MLLLQLGVTPHDHQIQGRGGGGGGGGGRGGGVVGQQQQQPVETEEERMHFVKNSEDGVSRRRRRSTVDYCGVSTGGMLLSRRYGPSVSILKSGDSFGEMALMTSQPRKATIICVVSPFL
jgi:CRP-like cAMP-binding protein